MGFFTNIFSSFAISTYKGICKAMINSYNNTKKYNPGISRKELYALSFAMRPGWKRENPSSYTFGKGSNKITIENKDTFKDLVMKVIFAETSPSSIVMNQEYIMEVATAVKEAFEGFNE
jgi:hypothetical protein